MDIMFIIFNLLLCLNVCPWAVCKFFCTYCCTRREKENDEKTILEINLQCQKEEWDNKYLEKNGEKYSVYNNRSLCICTSIEINTDITPDHIRYDSGKWVIWHNVKHSVLIGIFDSCHYLLSISEIVNWHFCSIWPIFIQIVWLIALTSSHFIFLALVKNIVGSYINTVCYCAWNLMYVRLCKRLISDINKWNS